MLLVSYLEFIHHLYISCDALSDLLRQHATDFKEQVDIEILPLVLFQNGLLSQQDMQHLQFPTMTESKKSRLCIS